MKQTFKQFINRIFYRQRIKFHGKNNSFTYPKTANLKKLKIDVWGNNNKIIIADNVHLNNTHIAIGFANCKVENCTVKIGYKSSFNGLYLQIGEDNCTVSVGEKCMCSYGIEINCTDHHSIFDANGNLTNVGESVTIGNHVWICKDVKFMKNTNIPNGCIVAQGSIVTKHFDKENCVIAGNPAKIVKENISWDRIRPNNFIKESKNGTPKLLLS